MVTSSFLAPRILDPSVRCGRVGICGTWVKVPEAYQFGCRQFPR